MRDIYFRAKRVDTKTWVYGDLLQQADFYGKGKTAYFIYENFDIARYDSSPPPRRVVGETIGQYTGLTDKNGVKIFEGDIICRTWLGGTRLYKVCYDQSTATFIGKCINCSGFTTFHSDSNMFEVIGNGCYNLERVEGG